MASGEQLSSATRKIRFMVAGVEHKWKENRRRRKDLPQTIDLTKGITVLVTDKVETNLEIINSTRREIVNIIVNVDEPDIAEGHIMHLKFSLVQSFDQTRAHKSFHT